MLRTEPCGKRLFASYDSAMHALIAPSRLKVSAACGAAVASGRHHAESAGGNVFAGAFRNRLRCDGISRGTIRPNWPTSTRGLYSTSYEVGRVSHPRLRARGA